jgi:hypothetical protein
MSSFQLAMPPEVADLIRQLPPEIKRNIKKALRPLSDEPEAGEPLRGNLPAYGNIEFGDTALCMPLINNSKFFVLWRLVRRGRSTKPLRNEFTVRGENEDAIFSSPHGRDKAPRLRLIASCSTSVNISAREKLDSVTLVPFTILPCLLSPTTTTRGRRGRPLLSRRRARSGMKWLPG